jgi:hypothetical protein
MGRVMVTVGIKGVSVSKPARIPTPGQPVLGKIDLSIARPMSEGHEWASKLPLLDIAPSLMINSTVVSVETGTPWSRATTALGSFVTKLSILVFEFMLPRKYSNVPTPSLSVPDAT